MGEHADAAGGVDDLDRALGTEGGTGDERAALSAQQAAKRVVHVLGVPGLDQRLGDVGPAHHSGPGQAHDALPVHRRAQPRQTLDDGARALDPFGSEPRQVLVEPGVLDVHVEPEDVEVERLVRGRDLDARDELERYTRGGRGAQRGGGARQARD